MDQQDTLGRYSYVFVLTYGRSGSTLLMKLLNQLPGYDIKGENFNALFKLFDACSSIEFAKRHFGKEKTTPDFPWYGVAEVNTQQFIRQCLNAFVENVLQPSGQAKVIGFKEVRHMSEHMSREEFFDYVAFLITEFPNAKVIFNTRDAESVSVSGWFKKRDPSEVKAMVSEATGRFHEATERWPDHCFLIDYADTCDGTDRLQQLYAFLDQPFSEQGWADVIAQPLTHMKKKRRRVPEWLTRFEERLNRKTRKRSRRK